MGDDQLEWLPVGWEVQVRVRRSGKKDKYYVNPSNGLKFCSKPEVLRFLKSSEKDKKPNKLDKIDGKKNVAGQLPPGWVKKIRRKWIGSRIRRDPYYIDPVSGRHFRSMPEVFRYLESEPDDRGHVSVELGDNSQSSSGEAKGQRPIDKKADKNLSGNQSAKSELIRATGLKVAAVKNVITLDGNHLEQREENGSPATELSDKLQVMNRVKKRPKRMIEIKKLADVRVDKKSANRNQRSKSGSEVTALEKLDMPILDKRDNKEDDSVDVNLSNKLLQENMTERVNGGRRRSMRLVDSKRKDDVTEDQSLRYDVTEDHSLQKGAEEKITSLPESIDLEHNESNSTDEGRQPEKLARPKKRKNPSCKSPRRASKRLVRVETEHPSPEIKTSNKSGVLDTPSFETEITTTTDVGKSGPSGENPTTNDEKNRRKSGPSDENPTTNGEKNPIISHDCKEDEKHVKNLDSSLEGLLMDPCIEFAVKTLTGAIPIEEVNKVGESPVKFNQSSASSTTSTLPSGHVWADPCFEFAVKMLTGEMPLGSSLDNVNHLNYSFDAVKKPCVWPAGRH